MINKLISTLVLLFILLSCSQSKMMAKAGARNRKMMGTTSKDVIKTVSIEKNCPADQIHITRQFQNLGNAIYEIEACGKRYVYKQIGSVIQESKE